MDSTPVAESLRKALAEHPALTTVEDVQDRCGKDGFRAELWTVYFFALQAGRRLTRRPPNGFTEPELRNLALILFGVCNGTKRVLEVLAEVHALNAGSVKVQWQRDKPEIANRWDALVAQELIDLSGSYERAGELMTTLWDQVGALPQ